MSSEDFHRILRFSQIFVDSMDFDGLPSLLGLLEGLVSRLAFSVFLRFSFHGFRWIVGLARLVGRFGFLALLGAGLNHGVSHARGQDGSAD